ncbi:MAG: hydrolase 1, exosortase A system-associated [Alphaproteobacteria bacterium]|nr:MAG: hydrolase 1, exosortase A system-associated [Alphaproteobacteria bacterium]
MNFTETAFTFSGDQQNLLIGIIHNPEQYTGKVGLLIVVGGPQYRIGAHRQYVHMARHCAARGIPVMRFDYQGIGDSDGSPAGFEHVTPDIDHAIDEFLKRTSGITSVAIWGLCEGASALLLGAARHKAVSHIILANPWVRSTSGLARATIKHYYLDRLKNPAFWRKIFSGHLNIKSALSGFLSNIRQAFAPGKALAEKDVRPFPERMLSGLAAFQGKTLLIMSEQDLVAREFDDLISSDKAWQKTIREKISQRIDIAETDHTFSSESWRVKVATSTADWLISGQ